MQARLTAAIGSSKCAPPSARRRRPCCRDQRPTTRSAKRSPTFKALGQMTRFAIFPGQGAQAVGMGRDLCETSMAAREVFAEVDEALGEPLSRLIFEGPTERLGLTE